MNRSTSRFALAATAIALVALSLSACKKEGGASGAAGDALGYLPDTSSMVVSFDFDKARSSELFKKYQDELLAQLPPEFNEAKAACGIDPITDINSVVFALGADPNDESQIVAVISGKFDQAKAEKCMAEVAKKDGKEFTKKEDGKIVVYTTGDDVAAHWAGANTVVISPSTDTLKKAIEGKGLEGNKDVMALVNKVDSGAALWVAGNIPAEAAGQMGGLGGAPPKSVYLSVKADSGVDAKLGLMFEKKEQAEQMKMMATMGLEAAKAQAGPFADLVKGVELTQKDTDLVIAAKLSGEQIDSLSKLAGSMGGF